MVNRQCALAGQIEQKGAKTAKERKRSGPRALMPVFASFASCCAYWLLAWLTIFALPSVAWADVPAQGIRRLDGATRAKVLAALAGLIILGFGMIALVWLGARMTQRYRKSPTFFRPVPRPGEHDWAAKPLSDKSDADGS
jgi:hypothetical protein